MKKDSTSEIIEEIQRKIERIEQLDDEIHRLVRAADNCIIGGGDWADTEEEEKYNQIWNQIFQKESEQWKLREEIEKSAKENSLLCFSTNIYYQYTSKSQTRRFLKAVEEVGIIKIDVPIGSNDFFILPPGSVKINETRKSIGDGQTRETTKIQLPTGKIVRFIDYAPGRSWGHLIL